MVCKRRIHHGSDYILLKGDVDVDMADLQHFLKENFRDVGILTNDVASFNKDSEVIKHLLRLLPMYKQCMSKYVFLSGFLDNGCRSHMRKAAEIECQKSKRVLEVLDVLMLKLVIGEFSMTETDTLEKLLDKFSADQSTLCEVEKIERLIDIDREESGRLMSVDIDRDAAILKKLTSMPVIPEDIPGEEDAERMEQNRMTCEHMAVSRELILAELNALSLEEVQ